ncbi:TraR/DksA family transcriptional regulator [Candidatus Uhrbacteria bacterium]|nr:TraR/DksA family transcriptional regulator [Candidatus Uhrbacteria bacterium]
MTNTFLMTVKEKLNTRKEQLERELKSFASRNPHASGHWEAKYVDFGRSEDENAAEVALYSDNLSLEHALEKEYRDVLNALSRITAGSYGNCRYCNQPIDEKRLLARPTSSACIACKVERKKAA